MYLLHITLQKCPRMKPFASNPTPLEEIYGVQKIQAELKKMNSKVRAKEQVRSC